MVAVGILQCRKSGKECKLNLLVIAAAGLFFVPWPPIVWLVVQAFEAPYPPRKVLPADAQGIVVSVSAVYPPSPVLPIPRLGNDTFERCLYAAWLYKNVRPLLILASGGTMTPMCLRMQW
jgi:uncharacterized SAM-binding protein YcdF (DUF218 family)